VLTQAIFLTAGARRFARPILKQYHGFLKSSHHLLHLSLVYRIYYAHETSCACGNFSVLKDLPRPTQFTGWLSIELHARALHVK
jgi:hypothetical protein